MARVSRLGIATAALAVLLAFSYVKAEGRAIWLAEVSPVLVGVPILAFTYRRFSFTGLVYGLIFLESVVCMAGGAWGYERVPLGLWLQHLSGGTRNPYDKVAHFAQGFVPALIIREFFVRKRIVRGRVLGPMVILWGVLAIGAISEMVEWGAALLLGRDANGFLAMQGDPFDTQSDLLFDFLGGVAALAFLARVHDRRIRALDE